MKLSNTAMKDEMEERFKDLRDEEAERFGFPFCYFRGDDQHYHEKGECMHCDWHRQMVVATGWDDPNFIEAWDYPDYWNRIKKLNKKLC